MSIMVVQLAPAGLLFGADRNITSQITLRDGQTVITVVGQSQRPKVLKWPNKDTIIGYVGQAELEGRAMDEWLYSFIGRHLDFDTIGSVANSLTYDLNALFQAGAIDSALVLHLGGFELDGGDWRPRIYFIRNTTDLTPEGQYVVGQRFDCSDEIVQPYYFGKQSGGEIKALLAAPDGYFSFRQGNNLRSFNVIDAALRAAMSTIVREHPARLHPVPVTLEELSRHVAFEIHGFGAYFAAFYPPFQQLVGGGADVVTAAWPDN